MNKKKHFLTGYISWGIIYEVFGGGTINQKPTYGGPLHIFCQQMLNSLAIPKCTEQGPMYILGLTCKGGQVDTRIYLPASKALAQQ